MTFSHISLLITGSGRAALHFNLQYFPKSDWSFSRNLLVILSLTSFEIEVDVFIQTKTEYFYSGDNLIYCSSSSHVLRISICSYEYAIEIIASTTNSESSSFSLNLG